MTTENTSPTGEQTPPSGDPPGQTPTPQSQTTSGSQKTPIESLPADIRDYIARLRTEAEEANKLRRAEAKAKQDAEEARLKEQGEFKALAEKHETRVKELEPISESYAALSASVNKQINADIKDWPEEVKSLDPGKDASVETRLAWVAKARPIVEKMNAQQLNRATAPGASRSPRPTGAAGDLTNDEARISLLKSGMYKAF